MRRLVLLLVFLTVGATACGGTEDGAADSSAEESVASTQALAPPAPEPATEGAAMFPDVIAADVTRNSDETLLFDVTVSSPYDSPERYADAWRITGADGTVYGLRELAHDHASEQPFTRSLDGVEIPAGIAVVTIETRDLANGWGGATVDVEVPPPVEGVAEDEATSPETAFAIVPRGIDAGASIPIEFTCDGSDELPVVDLTAVPDGALELALVVDDPDAPSADPFVHWVVYAIDATTVEIADGVASFSYGVTDAGGSTWLGPCPPRGDGPHTYRWRAFALSQAYGLEPGLSGRELEDAVADSVVAEADFTATYERAD